MSILAPLPGQERPLEPHPVHKIGLTIAAEVSQALKVHRRASTGDNRPKSAATVTPRGGLGFPLIAVLPDSAHSRHMVRRDEDPALRRPR
jgi:hypothetical protein